MNRLRGTSRTPVRRAARVHFTISPYSFQREHWRQMSAMDDVDYYAVLDVAPEATVDQIRTAYRKRSLKVHPDRASARSQVHGSLSHLRANIAQNPDNPQAAALFHELTLASQVLLDAQKRTAFDALRTSRMAHKARFAALDSKRKAMAEELERAEFEFKKRRGEEGLQMNEVQRLKEEGRKMREAKLKKANGPAARDAELDELKAAARQAKKARVAGGGDANGQTSSTATHYDSSTFAHELGPLDTTLKFRWPPSLRLSNTITDAATLTTYLTRLMALPADAATDAQGLGIDLVLPSSTKNIHARTRPRASIKFVSLAAAHRVMRAAVAAGATSATPTSQSQSREGISGQESRSGSSGEDGSVSWSGWHVEWAANEGRGPDVLLQSAATTTDAGSRRSSDGMASTIHNAHTAPDSQGLYSATAVPPPAPAPAFDAESDILASLRQRERQREAERDRERDKERARMEEQLRREDEEDEKRERGADGMVR